MDDILNEDFTSLPKTQKDAKINGLDFYFTGIPCKYGHISKRYARDCHCFECRPQKGDYKCRSKINYVEENIGLPSRLADAIENNSQFYFTGIPCKNGHISKRYANSRTCYRCRLEKEREIYKNLTVEEKQKRFAKNKEWIADNPDKAKAYYRKSCKKRRLDPIVRLNDAIGYQIWQSLKNLKNGRHWEELEFIHFTLEELKEHLEKQFTPEMSWDNYGKYWHVDHIKPKSLCSDEEEIWNLNNLQPLEAKLNMSKCNRYIGHPNNPQYLEKKNNGSPKR